MSKTGTITKLFGAIVALLICGAGVSAFADVYTKENRADVLYGQGVHAFFEGEYQGAVRLFKQIEQLGGEDPRPYFFLGLAYKRLGNTDLADAAFKKAAKLEWDGRAVRDYNVSSAMRRIQGNERIYVEGYRNQAKADWMKTEKRRQKELYGKTKTEEKDVLKSISESFVGAAPFGARSVHPFRTAENKREDQVIAIDEDQNSSKNAPDNAVSEQTTPSSEEKPKLEFKPARPTFEDSKSNADSEKKPTSDDDDDPFGDAEEEKKEDKKEDSKDDDEGEDPFA